MHLLMRHRMLEAEQEGVESLAREVGGKAPGGFRQGGRLGQESRPIGPVADERMADCGKVDPDLVGPSGLKPAFDHGGEGVLALRPVFPVDPVVGDGAPAAGLHHLHLLAVGLRAVDRRVDRALADGRCAPDQCLVAALERTLPAMVGELLGQAAVGEVALGADDQSRRVLVEAVDNARPGDAADARKAVAAMGDQRIDQRAAGWTTRPAGLSMTIRSSSS
jgi:hypothetical protein